MDPVTQKERWHAEGGGGIGGGTATTAGNLVIQVLNTGKLRAYTADKGERLLDIATPAGNGMGPPLHTCSMASSASRLTVARDNSQVAAGAVQPDLRRFQRSAPPPPAKPQLMVFMIDGKATK